MTDPTKAEIDAAVEWQNCLEAREVKHLAVLERLAVDHGRASALSPEIRQALIEATQGQAYCLECEAITECGPVSRLCPECEEETVPLVGHGLLDEILACAGEQGEFERDAQVAEFNASMADGAMHQARSDLELAQAHVLELEAVLGTIEHAGPGLDASALRQIARSMGGRRT